MAKKSSAATAAAASPSTKAPANPPSTPKKQLLARKKVIQDRLKEIDVKTKVADINKLSDETSPSSTISQSPLSNLPIPTKPPTLPPKSDTHWDFTLKEMAWLSADFQSERKRQISQAKKLSNAILSYHATLATKKARERAQSEAKVRRLAGKMGRLVQKHYWKKMERVVEYKQRLEGESNRRKEMDKRLVFLVRQTERYGESLTRQHSQHGEGVDEAGNKKKLMTIEEALSQSSVSRRRSASLSVDYTKMDRDASYDESSFYGESISPSGVRAAPDSPSRHTRSADSANNAANSSSVGENSTGGSATATTTEDVDDYYEPTDIELANEAQEEQVEYASLLESFKEQSTEELKDEVDLLMEEREMELESLIQRWIGEDQQEHQEEDGGAVESVKPLIEVIDEKPAALAGASETVGGDGRSTKKRRVCFASSHEEKTIGEESDEVAETTISISTDGIQDVVAADDDSQTQKKLSILDEDDQDEKDEFHLLKEEYDDERTIEAEEKLGRDMSYAEEIDLLNRENEMSIEELRAMYANMDQNGEGEGDASGDESDATENASNVKNDIAPAEAQDDEDTSKQASFAFASLEDDQDEKDEFHLVNEELDDETTIEAEEKLGRDMSYQEEIDLLNRENEMSVEELRAMYANIDQGAQSSEDENETSMDIDEGTNDEAAEPSSKNLALSSLDEDDQDEKDEFHLLKEELDDETTIEAEEKLGREMSYADEIAMLNRENEMSVEELRAMYANMADGQSSDSDDNDETNTEQDDATKKVSALAALDEDDQDEKDEFHLLKEEYDDETTIEAEEKLGRDMSYAEEIDMLNRENEMSVEELRAMYANMEEGSNGAPEDEDDVGDDDKSKNQMDISDDESSKRKHPSTPESGVEQVDGQSSKKAKPETDEGISALESLAASDTKARETMVTRPFLLASWVKLRAYQHIGLNWLVSIQSRRLNGILADEMGLGKTLQTISMLSYLASYKGIWGPHLIIVPTSCLVNWEVEFKRFCPGLKVMCYYGNAKRRKELRTGWTKANVHHVVITSYQLAVQDSFAFKRKKWYYLILDEAHNIKNFESQRWQTLIGFNTQRRLLLTGTPLQNNLMELWSLLHFLMPHVFTDRKQFSYWFSNPMDNIIEGNSKRNDDLINRLHGIIRPFVLRRLKKDVETQLPGKYEHIVKCQLSRRQMFLYEEFMARSSTRKALQSGGNFMGMMNVLMQLRKVCNHPDLFEPRSVTTPFVMEPLSMTIPSCVSNVIESKSALEQLSPFLRLPLWTIGRGTPSFQRSTSVDKVFAGQLSAIKTPESIIMERLSDDDLTEPMPHSDMDEGLFSFLARIRDNEKQDRVSHAQFTSRVNTWRCETDAFPYPDSLRQAVVVGSDLCRLPLKEELSAPQIAATPLELLSMRKSQAERAQELDEIADKFVFCVPKAGSQKPALFSSNTNPTSSMTERMLKAKISKALDVYFSPFKKAQSRLTMCMPDKKLVQFDAGKLQTLATLLRELKQGGHRVLIFTQMSKMLDVLEAFLNLNGHTYLRLDGGTDVDRRQRLMDRFNNDPKVFCFILSTRSGGLGINLTGADTVVFYDSDWNPAMDAQAQDRAHRIGQTREVHIYRMVTEHSIEENILTKAKQKRNLDFLVFNEGKFHATAPDKSGGADEDETEEDDGFTKEKIANILGIRAEDSGAKSSAEDEVSKDQIESTMAALEDEDDVKAMHSAKQEAAEALQEFDEAVQYKQDEASQEDTKEKDQKGKTSKQKAKRLSNSSTGSVESDSQKLKVDEASDDDKEMEKEFAQWQRKVGMDATTIHESLNPLERYGLHVKEYIDPYWSQYYWAEQQRLAQSSNTNDEWNIEEIEARKLEEEDKAFEDGDLLATFPDPESLPRQRQLYIREKARLRSEIMKRRLTGENWTTKIEERTGNAFWYNTDTGEARWDKPEVLKMLQAEEIARAEGWASMPPKPLVKILEYLLPSPERNSCAATCRKWRLAANNASFVLHVWPVELGALVMDDSKLGKNHYRTISDALQAALPGDTIELGDGHYFINDPGLIVNKAVKFVGDEHEPGHVVVELGGEIHWKSFGGWMEGITIRRSKMATGAAPKNDLLRIHPNGRLDMFNCVLDNRGSVGNCISVSSNASGQWERTIISGCSRDHSGLLIAKKGKVELIECRICDNDGVDITREEGADVALIDCALESSKFTVTEEEVAMDTSIEPALIPSH